MDINEFLSSLGARTQTNQWDKLQNLMEEQAFQEPTPPAAQYREAKESREQAEIRRIGNICLAARDEGWKIHVTGKDAMGCVGLYTTVSFAHHDYPKLIKAERSTLAQALRSAANQLYPLLQNH